MKDITIENIQKAIGKGKRAKATTIADRLGYIAPNARNKRKADPLVDAVLEKNPDMPRWRAQDIVHHEHYKAVQTIENLCRDSGLFQFQYNLRAETLIHALSGAELEEKAAVFAEGQRLKKLVEPFADVEGLSVTTSNGKARLSLKLKVEGRNTTWWGVDAEKVNATTIVDIVTKFEAAKDALNALKEVCE